jgi:hypothetical protein
MTNWSPKSYQRLQENMIDAAQAKGRLERKPLAAGLVIVEELTDIDDRIIELIKRKTEQIGNVVVILAPKSKPVTVPDGVHFIQIAADVNACPVFPGDERIKVEKVDE